MYAVTASEMRQIDYKATVEYGIPGMLLMENAGLRLVDFIRARKLGPRITVVAGSGNNGGDGFVAARHLSVDKQVTVWTTENDEEYSGDALLNLQILRKLGVPIICLRDAYAMDLFTANLKQAHLVLDAIFGTGLSRKLDDFYIEIITGINYSKSHVLSVDLPSGINSDTGDIIDTAILAEDTITFALPKLGHYLHPGAAYRGNLHVVDIGIPSALLKGYAHAVLTGKAVQPLLPLRPPAGHKGTFGSVLLIAGSKGMSGAAVLAADTAMRSGCGVLYAAVPSSVQAVVAAKVVEAITMALPETSRGSIAESALAILREKWEVCDVIAIGPGLSQEKSLLPILSSIISEFSKPLVIDADALNLLASNPALLKNRTAPTILTPHPGEAARLLCTSPAAIMVNRIQSARELAARFAAVVVLKGAHTIVADADGSIAFNTTGNNGMATAGSGDVLTGLITALLAQGLPVENAAKVGVYLHGLAGDLAAERLGERSLVASDLICYISQAYLNMSKNTYVERSQYNATA